MVSIDKTFYVFAGVNGAGKSTLFNIIPELKNMPRINLDEIVKIDGSWKNLSDVIRAGRKAVEIQKTLLGGNESFNQETTLCGHSILNTIETAKQRGFRIEVYYVGIDSVELCKKRIAKRVADGGHGIPEEDVERRYTESLANMNAILEQCDRVFFYDNTESFELVAEYASGKMSVVTNSIPKWFDRIFCML